MGMEIGVCGFQSNQMLALQDLLRRRGYSRRLNVGFGLCSLDRGLYLDRISRSQAF